MQCKEKRFVPFVKDLVLLINIELIFLVTWYKMHRNIAPYIVLVLFRPLEILNYRLQFVDIFAKRVCGRRCSTSLHFTTIITPAADVMRSLGLDDYHYNHSAIILLVSSRPLLFYLMKFIYSLMS